MCAGQAATPVAVQPIAARHGIVVAGHPEAAEAGLAILKSGGNAIDAAVATSLALGVAEPYGSGLGGKLMLLYYEAKSGRTRVVDAMDAAGSLDVAAYLIRPDEDHYYGYGAVCVPGLPAGLWAAHQQWGVKKWAENVAPAIALAQEGFTVLPKSRDYFAEQERKLRRGDPEIARLYLPDDKLPEVGSRLANADLARTLELLARRGRDGFYRGPVAEAIVGAAEKGGGVITREDLANYAARIAEPVTTPFRGYTLVCAPPPASGAALFLPIMKILEPESFDSGPLRSPENLDRIGRAWRAAQPQVGRTIADVPEARGLLEKLLAPDSIAALRAKAFSPPVPAPKKTAGVQIPAGRVADLAGTDLKSQLGELAYNAAGWYDESPPAGTTHFIVVDAQGNVVCATQSQSLHFGAGVVPPGTGVVLNNSMSNFGYSDPENINHIAPGKRARSTIAPTLVLRGGKPALAIGAPGGARIPTALLQVLLDRLAFNRPLADAIGDTRIHFAPRLRPEDPDTFEAEQSLPHPDAEAMRAAGWKVVLPERAGRGRHFGGVNAVEFNADGTVTGYADPRRTNAAVGY